MSSLRKAILDDVKHAVLDIINKDSHQLHNAIASGEVIVEDLVREFERCMWKQLGDDIEPEPVPEAVKSVMAEIAEWEGLPLVSGKLRGKPVSFICLVYSDGMQCHCPEDVGEAGAVIQPVAVLHPLECTEFDDILGPGNDPLEKLDSVEWGE